ncbi:MAG: N-acetyltransferase [Bryobacteraceae bacterium]
MTGVLTALPAGDAIMDLDSLQVRKAAMGDIAPLLELINSYAAKGVMLSRTEFELSENIRDFSVIYSGNDLLGCGALHFYSPTMGEVRSLAVAENAKTRGVGRMLVEALVQEAAQYLLDAVFAFTYVPQFFEKVGFREVERGTLPLKAWKDCLRCPKFQSCDEIAVLRVLNPVRWREHQSQSGLPQGIASEADFVMLPFVQTSCKTAG